MLGSISPGVIARGWWLPAIVLLLAVAVGAKTGPTYFTADELAAIRARAALPEFAGEQSLLRESAALIADLSDEEIWELVPAPELPRALNVRFGLDCPVHGKEVFKVGGHYPWIMSADRPFKVECPVGHEVYPSNDYAAYLRGGPQEALDPQQRYIDDGYGWRDAGGNRHFFVGYYNYWWRWRRTLVDGVEACGKLYLVTGEKRYAHKAAVALARLTQVYPRLNFAEQGVADGKYPAKWPGRISDRIWENGVVIAFARTYDAIFETLAGDRLLHEFAAARGVADVATAIERDILQVQVADIFAQRIRGNRFELGALSTVALVLQNDDPARGTTTREMVEWLLHGGGNLEYTFYNGFDRDGIGGESAPGYSLIWNERFVETAENLDRLGLDIAGHPKWRRLVKGPGELQVLDGMALRIGDSGGSIAGSPQRYSPALLRFGVTRFADPDCARWMLQLPPPVAVKPAPGGVRPTSVDRLFSRAEPKREEVERLAARAGAPVSPCSRVFGGYGLAVLELDDGAQRHAATMYFGGPAAWHQHYDRLTLGYFVGNREVLSELGYPSHWGPTADYWIKNTPAHYAVMIDEQPQPLRLAGQLTRFADLPGLKAASADARAVWSERPVGNPSDPKEQRPPPQSVGAYQRTLALLDTGEKSTLLIDAFLARGGSQHDYSFHGLPFGELACELMIKREQTRGTLAGAEVEYGADPGGMRRFSGYQFLQKPQWFAPEDVTVLRWKNDAGLNQTTWFPNFAIDEVIIADATPLVGPGFPRSMPYVFLRHQGREITSLFVSITEITAGGSAVRAVRRMAAQSSAAGGAEIEMTSGRRWRIYVNESDEPVRFSDGVSSRVALAVAEVTANGVTQVKLVGAGKWVAPNLHEITQQPIRWQVRSVDYRTGLVQLDSSAPQPDRHGVVVCARTGTNLESYTIRTAGDDTVGFGEIGLITGRFLGAWDPQRKLLAAQERIDGEYNQFNAKSFVGMSVVAEDLSFAGVVTGFDRAARTFTLDATEEAAEKLNDLNGDGRAHFYLADIGPKTILERTPARVVVLASQ